MHKRNFMNLSQLACSCLAGLANCCQNV